MTVKNAFESVKPRGKDMPSATPRGSARSKATRDGHIRRSEVLFPRSLGNGSLSPGWVAA